MKTIAQELNITEFPFQIEDSKGNLIYLECEDGFWYKCSRDLKGRVLYYEASNNYWSKFQYDEEGNQVYYENSDGKIEDNRPKEQQLKTKN